MPGVRRQLHGIDGNLRPARMPRSRNAPATGATSPWTSIMTKLVSEGMERRPSRESSSRDVSPAASQASASASPARPIASAAWLVLSQAAWLCMSCALAVEATA